MIKTLKYIAEQYGKDILKEGAKLIAYYADLAPRQKTERQMLEYLIKCNGNIKLLDVCQETQQEQQACVETLVKQLTSQLLMSEEAAYTVCDNFLQAIGGTPIQMSKVKRQTVPKNNPVTPTSPVDLPVTPLADSHTHIYRLAIKKFVLPVVLVGCMLAVLALGIRLGGNNANTYENTPENVFTQNADASTDTPTSVVSGGEGAIIAYMKVLRDTQSITSYSVYDINADGQKELIVFSGPVLDFYTYSNGYVANLGTLDARNSTLLHADGHLTLLRQQDGKLKFSLIKMNGNAISSEVVSQIEADENRGAFFEEYDVLEIMPANEDNPWGRSFDMLNDIFSGNVSSVAKETDYFVQTDSGFTDQRTTVASLPGGWIAVIDAEKMEVLSTFCISGEEVSVVGVTKDTIYIKRVDQYIEDGRWVLTVGAYDYRGNPGAKWEGYNKVWFEEGHLIMQYTREYVYPCETCIISPDNQVVFEDGAVWTVGSYGGEIYFLAPPDYFYDDMSQIDIYRLNADKIEFCGSIDTEFDGRGQLIPYFSENTVVVEKITLDDSSENWEDWTEIVTKNTYALDGNALD